MKHLMRRDAFYPTFCQKRIEMHQVFHFRCVRMRLPRNAIRFWPRLYAFKTRFWRLYEKVRPDTHIFLQLTRFKRVRHAFLHTFPDAFRGKIFSHGHDKRLKNVYLFLFIFLVYVLMSLSFQYKWVKCPGSWYFPYCYLGCGCVHVCVWINEHAPEPHQRRHTHSHSHTPTFTKIGNSLLYFIEKP